MTTIKNWLGHSFESSSQTTREFMTFARAFRYALNLEAGANYEPVHLSLGHFYLSGFYRNIATQKLAYWSISDVRYFPDSWHDNILVRTAEHERDFTGGPNRYATLDTFKNQLDNLTK